MPQLTLCIINHPSSYVDGASSNTCRRWTNTCPSKWSGDFPGVSLMFNYNMSQNQVFKRRTEGLYWQKLGRHVHNSLVWLICSCIFMALSSEAAFVSSNSINYKSQISSNRSELQHSPMEGLFMPENSVFY